MGTLENKTSKALTSQEFEVNIAGMNSRFQATPAGNELMKLGEELYQMIEPALGPYWNAREQGETRLLLNIKDKALATLPWELLCDKGIFLFRNQSHPICRLQLNGTTDDAPLSIPDWPLRMLIVVGSEEGDERVMAEEEVAQIIDSIVPHEAGIDWIVKRQKNKDDIVDLIEAFDPHIFHFIGHGGLDGELPMIRMYDAARGKNDDWNFLTLKNDLVGKVNHMRLAFINACRTSEAAQNGLWSLTDAFLQLGVSAVIGARAVISGKKAANCAGEFYRELFDDLSVDTAISRARNKMSGVLERDWATLSLEFRLPKFSLFSSCKTANSDPESIKRQFWEVRRYVGRHHLLCESWKSRLAEEKLPAIIKGGPKHGKSSAAKKLIERCLLANHEARYVNMRQRGNDYVSIMQATLDGNPGQIHTKPEEQPFSDTAKLKFKVLLSETLGEQLMRRDEASVEKLFEGFKEIVKEEFLESQILLVYDHLEKIEPSSLITTINRFSDWVRNGSRIFPMLVFGTNKESELGEAVNLSAPHFIELKLDPIDNKLYKHMAFEFFRRLVIARKVRSGWKIPDYEYYKGVAQEWVNRSLRELEDIPLPEEGWQPAIQFLGVEERLVSGKLLERVKYTPSGE